jgi:hypothetical protein
LHKLDDYSGDFNPDLKPSDFSHAALEKLIRTYAQLYKALDGFWYLKVMDRSGNDEALTCDIAVWEKLGLYEMEKISRAFNITGKDVKSVMKAFQLTPWAWNIRSEFEVLSDNHVIWKVNHCPTVNALEREGTGRENDICNNVEVRLNQLYASFFNPDIKVTCLKTPPRTGKDDYYCRWEFKL